MRHLPDYIRGKGSSIINNSSRTARVYQKDDSFGRHVCVGREGGTIGDLRSYQLHDTTHSVRNNDTPCGEPKHDRCHHRHPLNCGFSRAKNSGRHRYGAPSVTSGPRSRVDVTASAPRSWNVVGRITGVDCGDVTGLRRPGPSRRSGRSAGSRVPDGSAGWT
ncbi:hypothetical protein [Streptomyces sp. NPDC017673]|uniref:hypothetical protein n=1 Tax=unclassified Streptomyces TaxID=2593676 RepID=UPI00379FBA30